MASRSGLKYTVADGSTVLNKGQQKFEGKTNDGLPIDLGMQITDVVKTLFSVSKIKESGNIIIFGAEERDMIINKRSEARTMIEDNGRDYQLSLWLEVPNVPSNEKKVTGAVSCQECDQGSTSRRSVDRSVWQEMMGSEEAATFQRQDI